jgi:hypothetical protein
MQLNVVMKLKEDNIRKRERAGVIEIDLIKATYNKIGTRMTIGPLVDSENGERDMHKLPV